MSTEARHPKDLPTVNSVSANSLLIVTVFAANGQANLAVITVNNFAQSIASLLPVANTP